MRKTGNACVCRHGGPLWHSSGPTALPPESRPWKQESVSFDHPPTHTRGPSTAVCSKSTSCFLFRGLRAGGMSWDT